MGNFCRDFPQMQCDIGWEGHPTGQIHPPLMASVWLGRRTVTALLDTGSSVSLIRAHLVPQGQPVLCYTMLAGIYSQVCRWPVVRLPLVYNSTAYWLDILKVDDLRFPKLLGRDTPEFDVLLRQALPHVSVALDDQEVPSPSQAPLVVEPLDSSPWGRDDEFIQAQGTDPTLARIQEDMAVSEGQVMDARKADRLPHFEKVRGALWRVARPEREGGLVHHQLVVPQPYRS